MSGELSGWTVVVTRDEGEEGRLGRALKRLGATVLRIPTVETGPPDDPAPLRAALHAAGEYDWVALTSGRAVDALVRVGAAVPPGVRVAAVGPTTARKAEDAGLPVHLVGAGGGGEELARALLEAGVGDGVRVLFPASDRARPELSDTLRAAGARVERVVAYRTRTRAFDPRAIVGLDRADVVTFTSPSAVEGWYSAIGRDSARFLPESIWYVVIGRTTEEALAAHGPAAIVAAHASLEGVVDAVRELAAAHGRPTSEQGGAAEEPCE